MAAYTMALLCAFGCLFHVAVTEDPLGWAIACMAFAYGAGDWSGEAFAELRSFLEGLGRTTASEAAWAIGKIKAWKDSDGAA